MNTKQVGQKANANNSGVRRVSLKVDRSVNWPSANAGASGHNKGPGHQ